MTSTKLFFLFAALGSATALFLVPSASQEFNVAFSPAPIVTLAAVEAPAPQQVVGNLPVVLIIPAQPGAHLVIPAIGINAIIHDMGLTSAGAMAVPGNTTDVGWFSLGTRPGETGSAVIGGHNRWSNTAAIFDHLDQLKLGDVVSVIAANGISTSFVVRDMRTYDATDTETGIFESESGVHLNLITCSGIWNPSTHSYTNRLVIFTDAS